MQDGNGTSAEKRWVGRLRRGLGVLLLVAAGGLSGLPVLWLQEVSRVGRALPGEASRAGRAALVSEPVALARGVVGTAFANLAHLAAGVEVSPQQVLVTENGQVETAAEPGQSTEGDGGRSDPQQQLGLGAGPADQQRPLQPDAGWSEAQQRPQAAAGRADAPGSPTFAVGPDDQGEPFPFAADRLDSKQAAPGLDERPAPLAAGVGLVGAPAEELAELIELAAGREEEAAAADEDGAAVDEGGQPDAALAGPDPNPLAEPAGTKGGGAAQRSADPTTSGARPAAVVAAPVGPIHQVAPGETLSAIAVAYKVDLASVLAANGLDPSAPLLAGQRLVVPGGVRPIVPPGPAVGPIRPAVAPAPVPPAFVPPAVRPTAVPPTPQRPAAPPATPLPARPQTAVAAAPAPVLAAQVLAPVAPQTLPGGPLIRPVGGWVSQGFTAGKHNGVDLASPTGTPVHAAAPGLVVVSAQLPYGYGWRIMLDHGDGTTTLYAHLSRLDVTVGQRVSRGQVIGAVGATGQATGPHLHFEVALRGTVVDPLRYLP
jgi:murein DD-endopeptidase MepM/ murein hydrolase activator NlpD